VKLTGKRAAYLQKVGFKSRAAEIGYFNFDNTGAYAPVKTAIEISNNKLSIDGTNATATVSVTPLKLTKDIVLKAPAGFSVSPEIIPAGAGTTNITVTYNSSLANMTGQLVLRSGITYAYIDLTGTGTPLPEKDLSSNPVYPGGSDTEFLVGDAEGFTPSNNGYTVEFSAKTPAAISFVDPFAITSKGVGFESSVKRESFVMKNTTLGWLDKILADKASQAQGGSGVFYPDDEFHTYRYAVAPDNRVHIYRDGVLVDQIRTKDLGLQPAFLEGEGDVEENLLVNGSFEGEYEYIADDPASKILGTLEGWNIAANDRWNSEQFIDKQEIAGVSDFTNHTLRVQRYAWQNGWGAAEYSQIVDVVPGETYTFSALAKGGYSSRISSYLGSFRIQEVKGTQLLNEKKIDVNSDTWQEYSMNYTTSATAKQVRVVLYLERGDTWSQNAAMDIDNVKLTGKRAAYLQKVGFKSRAAEIGYFNFDNTGAYAPVKTGIDLEISGIRDVPGTDPQIFAYKNANLLFFKNIPEKTDISVYNASGVLVTKNNNYSGEGIHLPQKGIYMAVIRKGTEIHTTVKILY
jgi:hypothetical protein